MGFYLRKSIKAGPFRLNLSKSGLGVSAGIPGFRVGSGPRGNYVHLGRHGVYYRSSFHGGRQIAPGIPAPSRPSPPRSPAPAPSDVVLSDVTGATTLQLAANNPGELLTQINDAARRQRIWPWVVAGGVLAAIGLGGSVPGLAIAVLIVAGGFAAFVAQRDDVRRSVVVFYDVNDEPATKFQHLVDAFAGLQHCVGVWAVTASGAVGTTYQYKTHAGASQILRRSSATRTIAGPPVLKTNIVVPGLQAQGRTVHFLPDRILVRQGRVYAEADYSACTASSVVTRFIEDGRPPSDSEVVGSTWRFVNVKGGPDRRFNNNRQLPILSYGELTVSAANGFQAIWQFSQPQAADAFAAALMAQR